MTEKDYWARLEYRVCRELQGSDDRQSRWLWCDGFIPDEYIVDDRTPRITGKAWICHDRTQEPWAFTLILPPVCRSREGIDWVLLLPADDMTGWLALDAARKQITVEPGIAARENP